MWNKIEVSVQDVESVTEKAVLIKMPDDSKYKGFKFWLPKKMVQTIDKKVMRIEFPDDFKFKIYKEINADEILSAYIKHV